MKPHRESDKRLNWIVAFGILLSLFTLVSGIIILFIRKKRAERKPVPKQQFIPALHEDISGLTETEVESRQQEGIDNSISFKPRRSKQDIWRKNIFSIFNLGLLGIAFVQMLLGLWSNVLTSLGVMVLNIGLNIFQEMFARRRLKEMIASTRLKTTVIRENKVRSIDPNEIVKGDIVVIGPGDQVFVDGEIVGKGQVVVDESLTTGKNERFMKQKGDKVYAGGYCLSGRVAYEVQSIGEERVIYSVLKRQKYLPEELTPLEKIIDRVLKGLLVIVGIFSILLLSAYFKLDVGLSTDMVNSAASVIFSIAPAGLFFMILVTYAAGTADIGKIGALVNRARIIESLAQIHEVCIVKSGILTDIDFEIEPVELSTSNVQLSNTRIRQILGDFVHCTSSKSQFISILSNEIEGNQRSIIEDAPFLNVFGWSAISIDEEDMRGVYVLGSPDILSSFIQSDLELNESISDENASEGGIKSTLSKVSGLFKRNKKKNNQLAESTEDLVQSTNPQKENLSLDKVTSSENHEKAETNITNRIFSKLGGLFKRDEKHDSEAIGSELELKPSMELLFAYKPEIYALHDNQMNPQIQKGLIPLAKIQFREGVTKIAYEIVRKFSELDIQIKVFSRDDPETTLGILKQTGISETDQQSLETISGPELNEFHEMKFLEALDIYSLFTSVQPQMMSRIVQTLRGLKRYIAVFGDGVKDIPALMSANVAIVRHDSSQAALSVSDIVMLHSESGVLKKVLEKGQRIVTGLLNILKLYLTQALYLTLLIISTLVLDRGFPYKSTQGSLIAIVTITIPALGLTLFAKPGVKDSSIFGKTLSRFVLPAAVSMSAAASIVFSYFALNSGEIAYAQLTVTYCLVYSGLILVIFVSPPVRILAGGAQYTGDWKPTILVIIMLFVFMIAAPLSITKKFFELDVLNQNYDYFFIGVVVICWAIVLQLLWRLWPLAFRFRKIDIKKKT
jgi:magnesium-transporting ATPase (P-type)